MVQLLSKILINFRNEDIAMHTNIIRTNFSFTARVKDVLQQFFPETRNSYVQISKTLPYISWSYGGWRIEEDRIGEPIAPGYRFGEIEVERAKDRIVVTHDGKRHVAIGLRDDYDDAANYVVDCIDRQFSIDKAP